MKSSIKLFGNFGMTVYDVVDGQRVKLYSVTKKNQITTEGQMNLLHLLGDPGDLTYVDGEPGTLVANKRLGKLIIGTNTQPPAKTDTRAAFSEVWTSPLFERGTTVTIEPGDADYIINILVVVPAGDLTGQTIKEAGIVTADDLTLYARQIYTPLLVGDSMSITFNWQLGMTLQS